MPFRILTDHDDSAEVSEFLVAYFPMVWPDHMKTGERRANARLIAAAPAMAALLRIIYDTPGITPILPSGVARQIQDCLVTAGLIK